MGAILALKVEEAQPLRRGNDYYWSVIRDLTLQDSHAQFWVPDIASRCDASVARRTVRSFVNKLVANDVAELAATQKLAGGQLVKKYRLLRRPVDTPLLGNANGNGAQYGRVRQQMWDTIRYQLKGGFTIDELVAFASTEDVAVSRASAILYVRALRQAGVLLTITEARPHHAGQWRIKPSADTGPKAPKVLNAEIVFDANEQRVLSQAVAIETGGAR